MVSKYIFSKWKFQWEKVGHFQAKSYNFVRYIRDQSSDNNGNYRHRLRQTYPFYVMINKISPMSAQLLCLISALLFLPLAIFARVSLDKITLSVVFFTHFPFSSSDLSGYMRLPSDVDHGCTTNTVTVRTRVTYMVTCHL